MCFVPEKTLRAKAFWVEGWLERGSEKQGSCVLFEAVFRDAGRRVCALLINSTAPKKNLTSTSVVSPNTNTPNPEYWMGPKGVPALSIATKNCEGCWKMSLFALAVVPNSYGYYVMRGLGVGP